MFQWRACVIVLMLLGMIPAAAGENAALRVAVAQPMVIPGDVDGNIQRMIQQISEASTRGAEVIVFSECALTGYDLKGVGAKNAIASDAPALTKLADLARKHNIAIIAGFYEKNAEKVFNSAGVFMPDGRRVIQRKYHVMEDEKKNCGTVPGERKRTLFEINGFKCAILICADTGIPGIYDELEAEKCAAIFAITAGAGRESSGFRQAELSDPERLKKYLDTALACIGPESVKTSLRLKIAQVFCNQSGWQPETGYYHPGGSCILDHTGEASAVIPPRFVLEHVKADMAIGTITKNGSVVSKP
jgi:predicted amidohydrolase